MNEIRMYVEHLFSGRVLTDDTIELKEEIYGNLVARYEDYVDKGMTSDEALLRAKESITSIDEVLGDLAGENAGVAEPESTEVDAAVAGVAGVAGVGAAGAGNSSGAAGVGASATAAAEATGAKQPRKKRALVIGSIAAGLVVLFVAAGAYATTWFGAKVANEAAKTSGEATVAPLDNNATNSASSGNDAQSSSSSSNNAQGSTSGNLRAGDYAVTLDANGNASITSWADELATAVVASTYADVAPYTGSSLSSTDNVNKLVNALPMTNWLNGQPSVSGNSFALSYLVSDAIDGDSVELAMVYDATALFCAMEDCVEIRFTIAESDEPHDTDVYVFTRAAFEQAYGVTLNANMVTDEGWKQLKNENLYQGEFAERRVDAAELDR